jgi:hypothetical protein
VARSKGKAKSDAQRTALLEPAQTGSELQDVSTSWLEELAKQHALTPKGRTIAHFLGANPRYGSFVSASDLADKLSVNVATVVGVAPSRG